MSAIPLQENAAPAQAEAGTPMLEVENLTLQYSRKGPVIVDDVSFSVAPGETVGLVGESGSGKTTIGRSVLGLLGARSGAIRFQGEDITHLSPRARRKLQGELRAVFQDPYSSLNPRRTVGESLAEPLKVAKVPSEQIGPKIAATLEAVGLPANAAGRFPRQFSGGQRQRIAIARALITDPQLVVCDEAVSALDLSTQAQVLNLLADLREERGLSYLFIAHDISVVEFLAQRVVVLYRGQVMESGPSSEVVRNPRHPFTKVLIAASPVPNPATQKERRAQWSSLKAASAGAAPADAGGCPFAARCPLATDLCRSVRPKPRRLGEADVACHFAEE